MDELGTSLNVGSTSGSTDQAELSRLIAMEQQKAQFQLKVHNFTDVCWEKCVEKLSSRLDSRTEACVVNCVDRFVDTTLAVTNRFAQMVQKGGH
ncbi:mitochondrial import inner membrane translocase subunit Tim8 B [Stegostoma tigrinum]|uniref:mitochondrial import inner membrane translocase subunit Tim8 B n=1 Tax=Stegostoma tigrinum TaxID=3053191 RepID=UPI00202AE7B3|nr:mitochondrial import inner membrane translocase subunit Tim8 B [Stegostoma tigrinum]